MNEKNQTRHEGHDSTQLIGPQISLLKYSDWFERWSILEPNLEKISKEFPHVEVQYLFDVTQFFHFPSLFRSIIQNENSNYDGRLDKFSKHLIAFWKLRKDFQSSFDLNTAAGRKFYLDWFVENSTQLDSKKIEFVKEDKLKLGINLIGYAGAAVGIGENLRSLYKILTSITPTWIFPLTYHDQSREQYRVESENYSLPGSINIFLLPPHEIYRFFLKYGPEAFSGRRNIGSCYWEFDRWPKKMQFCFEPVQEVWTLSNFVKNAFDRMSIDCKIMKECIEDVKGIEVKTGFQVEKSYLAEKLKIKKSDFVFFFNFDLNSSLIRKNPVAIGQAFQAAFNSLESNVKLIFKVIGTNYNDENYILLKSKFESDSRIYFLEGSFTKNEYYTLFSEIDCYVSLHRAEGFGRGIAEALMLEKQVICTGYSGNMDFVNTQNSYLVDFKLVSLSEGSYQVASNELSWAEPNISQAAQYMQMVYEKSKLGSIRNSKGREDILGKYSIDAVKENIIKNLDLYAHQH